MSRQAVCHSSKSDKSRVKQWGRVGEGRPRMAAESQQAMAMDDFGGPRATEQAETQRSLGRDASRTGRREHAPLSKHLARSG
jgi:hypothetical protein